MRIICIYIKKIILYDGDMIVCMCKRINSSQVKEALDRGITDVEQLSEDLGLGTGCGGCVEYAREMVAEELGQVPLFHRA